MSKPNELERQWRAIEDAIAVSDSRAIQAKGGGVGQSKVFAFARILRGWDWSDKSGNRTEPTGEQVADYIESIYIQYWKPRFRKYQPSRAEGLSFWDGEYIGHADDPRGEFLVAWDDVRVADGKTLLETAEKNAKTVPLKPSRVHSGKYSQFVSFAGHLQRLRKGGQTIQLPVHVLAKQFGVSPRMISKYRHWAMEDGILSEVRPANSLNKQATDFRFHVVKFSWKSGFQTSEPIGEPTVEPITCSPGGSTIGSSGSSKVLQSLITEPNGCALETETLEATAEPTAKALRRDESHTQFYRSSPEFRSHPRVQ